MGGLVPPFTNGRPAEVTVELDCCPLVDELAIGGGGCFSLDFSCSWGCLLLVRLIIFPDSFRLLLFVDMTTGML